MKPRLYLSPERRLSMTFAMQQALAILQMPQLELGKWLWEEIEKNPLLKETTKKKPIFLQNDIPATASFYDELMRQIHENFSLPTERQLAKDLVEYLDEKGFITTPLEEIGSYLQQPLDKIESILAILQTFEPAGIFARNLRESLLIQLKTQGNAHTAAFSITHDCFDDLLHGRFCKIQKKLGSIDIAEAIETIAHLSLRPIELFKQEATQAIIPDLTIEQIDQKWTIEIQDTELPKFQIHAEYASLNPTSLEEKETLRIWLNAGKWLLRSLKRRKQILLQIGLYLTRYQAAYLLQKGPLKKLPLQTLAKDLNLHESTLSRALCEKYAVTPRGILPLRSLINGFPETKDAKELLRTLIESEDKQRPLSDQELSCLLEKQGHKAARRTIAKYRKELKISPASTRKILLKNSKI